MSRYKYRPGRSRVFQAKITKRKMTHPLAFFFFSVFDEISEFCRTQRGLNLIEYEPQLAHQRIVHLAQNRYCSSNARGSHPRGCPTGVGLTRRPVSVPCGVKSTTNWSRYNTQPDTNLSCCPQRARSVGASVRSLCQVDDVSSKIHCAFCE